SAAPGTCALSLPDALPISRLLACLAAAAIAPSPESTVAAQQLTAPERAATVASVWAEARYNFAYWDRVRADWDSGLVANLKLARSEEHTSELQSRGHLVCR